MCVTYNTYALYCHRGEAGEASTLECFPDVTAALGALGSIGWPAVTEWAGPQDRMEASADDEPRLVQLQHPDEGPGDLPPVQR